MSRPLKKRLFDAVWDFTVTALCAVSIALLWSLTLTGDGGRAGIVLSVCLCSLLVTAVDHGLEGRFRTLGFLVLAALLVVSGFTKIGPVYDWIQSLRALLLHWQGVRGALSVYANDLRALVSCLAVVTMYTQTRDDAFGTAVFTFVLLVFGCFVLRQYTGLPIHAFSIREGVLLLLPGIGGLLMNLSANGGRTLRAVPAAALLTALAFFLMPSQGTTLEPMERLARDASDYLQTAVLRSEREGFSLPAAGFGESGRLGGAARPGQGRVLRVSGPAGESLYLRGYTCDAYTGASWEDTLSDGGALFALGGSSRDALFDLDKPLPLEPETVTVHLLADGSSTVFTPQRLLSYAPEGDEMGLYYTEAAELFVPRNLIQGDEYHITYVPVSADDQAIRELITERANLQDSRWAYVTDRYLTVPAHMSMEVYELAYQKAGTGSPLEKALNLRDYLKKEFTYTLNGADLPAGQDFVTWFLLTEKKGYCTYFASALTMLCRMNGIPARYAAGYHAVLNADGQAEVTQSDAHAWTEIYLNGFGWLALDGTPGSNGGTRSARTATPRPSATPTPTPTPAPTAENRPSSSPSPSPSPTNAAGASQGTNTPSPSPSELPSAAPSPDTDATDAPTLRPTPVPAPEGKEPIRPLLWLFLLLLVLIVLFILRVIFTQPLRRANKHPDKAGQILMDADLRLLKAMGQKRQAGETWTAYGQRLEKAFPEANSAFRQYSASIYGREPLPREDAEALYRTVQAKAGPFAKLRALFARVFLPKG